MKSNVYQSHGHVRRTRTISDSESTELPDVVMVEEMPTSSHLEDDISVVCALCLCTIWCIISVLNNIISKTLLNAFPYPLTSTLGQLLLTAICAEPVVRFWKIPPIHWENISTRYIFVMIIPLGIGKFMAACGTHISVSKLPVSYAHTVKASMPIFVVFLSSVLFKERYSKQVYLSLLVIFSGVALASITELSFNLTGMMFAVIATMSFAMLNILTKRCLNQTHIHQFRLLLLLARISTVMFLPIWLYNDLWEFLQTKLALSTMPTGLTLLLLFTDGCLNFAQNLVAFTLIAKITPLSYAVCNVVKRIAVIVLSIMFFGNPVTLLNILGTKIAIVGVFMYNVVKSRSSQKHKPLLPMTKSDINLSASFSGTSMQQLEGGASMASFSARSSNQHRHSMNGDLHYRSEHHYQQAATAASATAEGSPRHHQQQQQSYTLIPMATVGMSNSCALTPVPST